MNRTEQLKKVKDEVVACQKCALSKTRTFPVIGQGSHDAKIMFVGEAPGANEDKMGRPFCGKSGDVLDELLLEAGIKREDVYICNILKCRPPGNRNPLKEEIELCTPFLKKQIELIKPKVIGALGNYAASFLLSLYGLENRVEGISKMHGHIFEAKNVIIAPLYHPAVMVYNKNMRDTLVKDFRILREKINEL